MTYKQIAAHNELFTLCPLSVLSPPAQATCLLLRRCVLRKLPGAAAHILHSVGGFPAKKGFCLLCIGPEGCQITVPAGAKDVGQFHVIGLLESIDQFHDRNTVAGTQVDGLHAS